MKYTPDNCYHRCLCYHEDVRIKDVFEIDTDSKTVSCYEQPLRIIGDEVAKYQMTFDSVDIEFHPDYPSMPTEFQFYGLRPL